MTAQATEQPIKDNLLAQIKGLEESGDKKVIKTREVRARVRKEFVGYTLAIFSGDRYRKVHITDEMVGKPLRNLVRETPTAQVKFVSIPPRKMRQVADLVKGMPVEKAMNVLNFTPKIAAHHMVLTLKSAVANVLSAEGTGSLNPEDLYIKRITVDPGPSAKRIRFRSMGRAFRWKKRFCHLAIYLDQHAGTQTVSSAPKKKVSSDKADEVKPKKAASKKKATPKILPGKTKSKMTTKAVTTKKTTQKKTGPKKAG